MRISYVSSYVCSSDLELLLAASGGALDGVIAKPSDEPYHQGERAMRKVKQLRTADCVVGGYRKNAKGGGASLLLGLYDAHGKLDLVGFTSAFPTAERMALAKKRSEEHTSEIQSLMPLSYAV